MPISERTLRKWRKRALQQKCFAEKDADSVVAQLRKETAEKILRLTQELLDQHLLKK